MPACQSFFAAAVLESARQSGRSPQESSAHSRARHPARRHVTGARDRRNRDIAVGRQSIGNRACPVVQRGSRMNHHDYRGLVTALGIHHPRFDGCARGSDAHPFAVTRRPIDRRLRFAADGGAAQTRVQPPARRRGRVNQCLWQAAIACLSTADRGGTLRAGAECSR